jgi:cystathionine beta-lyase
MRLDEKLQSLPLTKTNPVILQSLFGEKNIVPMWVADMEFEVAKPIQQALINRVSNSGFGYEYKPDSFFESQSKWYKKHYGFELDRQGILWSPTISSTIAVAIENFTAEADGIIIQTPVFMEFREVIRNVKRKIIKNPLRLNSGQYEIDFDGLEEKAKDPSSKMLILCNPHNPVGRVWTKEELAKVVNICATHNLVLVADEIHKDIILFGNKFTSVASFASSWNKLIVCHSEAKTFNLGGIADSLALVSDYTLRESIGQTLKKYNLGRTNALTRVAVEAGYNEGEEWLSELLATIEVNVLTIQKEIDRSGLPVSLIMPEGTYQVWLDFGNFFTDSKKLFTHISTSAGIALNAGHWFGSEGALFMRMNIATSTEKVAAAMRKIIDTLPANFPGN